jgi:DNA-binding PadR family transcriptional regulator
LKRRGASHLIRFLDVISTEIFFLGFYPLSCYNVVIRYINARHIAGGVMVQVGVEGQLPLTEATFLIMLSLVSGPKHGYAIMKDVETLSESRVLLSTGTLYGALKRLLEEGWIARTDDEESNGPGRPRKVYTLTRLGRRVLDAEVERLNDLVAVAQLRTGEVEA